MRGALRRAHPAQTGRATMSKAKFFALVASLAVVPLGSTASLAQQPPPQSPNMTFFVTSAGPGKGADLGGLEGADRHCQTLAQNAGAGSKTWRAYLSSNAAMSGGAVNARDRIGSGPWQNFKGVAVAQNVDDLHSDNNKLSMENSLTERGTVVSGTGMTPNWHDVLTGSTPEGRAFPANMKLQQLDEQHLRERHARSRRPEWHRHHPNRQVLERGAHVAQLQSAR